MHNLKIGIVAPNLSGKGGTETVLEQVINYKKYSLNLDFSLFLSDGIIYPEWINKLNVSSNRISINNKTGFFKFLKKISYFIHCKENILLVLGPRMVFIAWLVRIFFFKKYKIVSWIHFSLFDGGFMNPKYLKYADNHMAIATKISKQLRELGVSKEKVFTIYNPVRRSLQTIDSVSDNTLHIIYIGRVMLDGQKNLRELIDALSHLPKYISFTLDIYGSGTDEELRTTKNYAKKISGENSVIFYGWVQDPWQKIEKADVLVLTSRYEGFGLVLAESISRGLPVISSNCPVGPDDIIQEKVNGFFYQSGNVQDLTNVLENYKIIKAMDRGCVKESLNSLYDKSYYSRFERALISIYGGSI
ncbi:glycosyltransferase [Leuconostoc mesenteroides]|uniref:glycosyltransferase n=2 Tax=Leuconostoc mesenteroides TaxID=1245 RepID=UPI001C1F47F2|nr:glycosyltransferase [Leuconostoc mesenteroides]MBU7546178.1 glycosyltransferase [Leuconostoc mesenteroides]